MLNWSEVRKIFNSDKKIFEVLAIILSDDAGSDFSRSIKNLNIPSSMNMSRSIQITIADIVLARQLYLYPNETEDNCKVKLYLLSDKEFSLLAIEAVESLLDDFKAK